MQVALCFPVWPHFVSLVIMLLQVHCRTALSLILEGFDDNHSENKDVPVATDDEDYMFMPSEQSDISEVEFEHEYDNCSLVVKLWTDMCTAHNHVVMTILR